MKRINLFLTIPQYDAIQQYRRRTGLSLSEIIRRAIDKFLREES